LIDEKKESRKSRDTVPVKGQLQDILGRRFFSSINPTWGTDSRAYGFVFAELIGSKVVKIGFRGVNDPKKG
jgi:hypothetical protein